MTSGRCDPLDPANSSPFDPSPIDAPSPVTSSLCRQQLWRQQATALPSTYRPIAYKLAAAYDGPTATFGGALSSASSIWRRFAPILENTHSKKQALSSSGMTQIIVFGLVLPSTHT
ncbi:hypothetical protein BDY19DRAFT_646989 [Irpex rosettiformis]|uniref:Uncharacterized protein n=1 Tax=Irpex rosettiformis TaxID=378272 RepID=A0ACB8UBZ4_9APHY|nr:hypothetical protein BDY19DRAFT_646989 [Irpex rosettiformis]